MKPTHMLPWLNPQQAYNLDLARRQLGEGLEVIEPHVPVAVNAVKVEEIAMPDDPQNGP